MSGDEEATTTTARWVSAGLVLTIAGSVAFVAGYAAEAGTQALGLGLGSALLGAAVAAGAWGKALGRGGKAVGPRHTMPSPVGERRAVADRLATDGTGLSRRRSIQVLLTVAGAGLVSVAATPLRSLGPSPHPALETTAWRPGRRLVDRDGRPVRLGDLEVDSAITVYPDGAVHSSAADSQVMLVRMPDEALHLPPHRQGWAPEGHVAYSKVCTHAGCPVGLYEAESRRLLCPCHQSSFEADRGARVAFGPAARPLPQLPIAVDDDGFLLARGDFPEPIGPSYWSRP